MTTYPWDMQHAEPLMPATGETVNGQPFPVPRRAKSLAIHCPTLVASATLKIQALKPADSAASETWSDVHTFNLADGTMVQLDGIQEARVTTLPASATGGGMLRFVASSDQSSAPVTIPVVFNFH